MAITKTEQKTETLADGITSVVPTPRRKVVLVLGQKHLYHTLEFLAGKVYDVEESLADALEALAYSDENYFAPAGAKHKELPVVRIGSASAPAAPFIVDLGGADPEVTAHLEGAIGGGETGTGDASSTEDDGVTV